jgi:hypothetical protein
MVTVKMVGPALKETTMLKGKETAVAKMTVSPDGKVMTTEIIYTAGDRDVTFVATKQ